MSRECCEKAVELAAWCREIDYDYRTGWKAILWCNALGEYIVGHGATALAAVEDAHAKDHRFKQFSK